MGKNHDKISISLPKALNFAIDKLVEESKNTPRPISKSHFIAVACYEYLEDSLKILESLKTPKEDN